MPLTNALTIDVEDYYQVSNFERDINRDDWPQYESRVVESTRRILDLLNRYDTKATFFVLGYVAHQHPELVSEIDAAGHEVGSHTYWHRMLYHLTRQQFRDDLRQSRDILQDLTGKPVTSFRAPSFSVVRSTTWALEILADEGFTIDSSIFPVNRSNYGMPNASREPYPIELANAKLWEFPMAVHRIWNRFNLPISGGGYFRFLPYGVTHRLLRHTNERLGLPFVFYAHPWEFDPQQPRLKFGTRRQRFKHYCNLHTTESKFERLLKNFSFDRIDRVLDTYVNPAPDHAPLERAVPRSFAVS
jgi:polysaccharide deacetylase family protein (PEP-CTERM system associated)